MKVIVFGEVSGWIDIAFLFGERDFVRVARGGLLSFWSLPLSFESKMNIYVFVFEDHPPLPWNT